VKLDEIVATAERLGLEPDTIDALAALLDKVGANAELTKTVERLAQALAEDTPADALLDIAESGLEARLGRTEARTLNLILALSQVPQAEERRAASGIDEAITQATLKDLPVWVHHFNKHGGIQGITLPVLEWAQRYLRGDLVRIGSAHFDLVLFHGKITVYRHRFSRELSARSAEGLAIDLVRGVVLDVPAESHPSDTWEVALEPEAPVLELHIPADSFVSRGGMSRSLQEAFAFFARRNPGTAPVGACGEAWLLDPQIPRMLPRNVGLHAIQAGCSLYPSSVSEEATLQRIFGPDVTRAHVPKLPRESMNSLQRAVAQFLADPNAALRARGGFILREELARLTASRNDWRRVTQSGVVR
jgi:hypothetical protein